MFDFPFLSSNIRVRRIAYVEISGESPKMIGKNAVKDDHGATTRERLVRVFTDTGQEGFGVTRASADEIGQEAEQALGQPVSEFLDPAEGIRSRGLEHALWDLVGQISDRPVWTFLGPSRRERIEAYDGGLYFCDLVAPEKGLDRVAQEAQESVDAGHRAIKMKIGRGYRWMSAEEGFARDVAAIRRVRTVVGPDVLLMVDGNNGFDRAGAERLFEAIGDQDICWAEKLFPETIDDYVRLRDFLTRKELHTLIADGETLSAPEGLYPFIEPHLIDVAQLDMNQIGLSSWRRLAAFCEEFGVLCAPHTWSSRFALYASLHLGKAIPNFLSAEVPAYIPDVYHPVGFSFFQGAYRIAPLAGWGLQIDEKGYREHFAALERVWEK
ncbi:MAG: hypothetical protein FJY97_09745 [candidate division Zixibacteria bacterium]|nr:hypothetical protein [candidate division Zixibacteria bacterium]